MCQIYILKLRNMISEVNSLYRINRRLDTERDGISKSERKSLQNIQTVKHKGMEGLLGWAKEKCGMRSKGLTYIQ